MKSELKVITMVLLFGCISACTKSNQIYDGFLQGIYNISNQSHQLRYPENSRAPDENALPYILYKKEREGLLNSPSRSAAPPAG